MRDTAPIRAFSVTKKMEMACKDEGKEDVKDGWCDAKVYLWSNADPKYHLFDMRYNACRLRTEVEWAGLIKKELGKLFCECLMNNLEHIEVNKMCAHVFIVTKHTQKNGDTISEIRCGHKQP